ncbi:DNA polymerase III subunit beta [Sinorhizobium meliloti]|uniref:DNA polymerase III subunit beta n=1 Tax=Rhizobium meliloti TaxID=382 RepID=UPI0012961F4A|nr:DNA polymerase III subunit beta [Sinorhizobium meliloti]MQW24259.1 DNA polymerase III subunit beta [Sinorhizobium meliloti]
MAAVWFSIHRSNLHQAFSCVMGAIEVRNTIAILSHVLFEPAADTIRLRGSNLDMQIDAECEAISVDEEIPFAIPADKFKAILSTLPESAEISFGPGRSKDSITISAGHFRSSVPFLPAADFPLITSKEALEWTSIVGAPLSQALDKAGYALPKTNDRPYLTGFCLHGERGGDGIVVAATDGLSLARVAAATGACPALPSPRNSFPHVILPSRAADSIRKLLDGAGQGCAISVTDAQLAVRLDGVTITTKLIDGIYPEYERVIPPQGDQRIGMKTDNLSASIKRVCVMIDDAKRDALFLRIRDGLVNVDLASLDGGSAHDAISAEIEAPEGLEVSLNGLQVAKTLASISSPQVDFYITPEKRIVVRPIGAPGETYVLSPMVPRFGVER